MKVTFQLQPGTTLACSSDPARIGVSVLGRKITVRGFSISGGRNGIVVVRGASALIDGNTIEDTGARGGPGSGLGINVAQNSWANIINNTLRNNRGIGILVHESSAARIGFQDIAGKTSPNTIQNNAAGIQVSRAANARIVGATITGNKGDGIYVERSSHAEVANNKARRAGPPRTGVVLHRSTPGYSPASQRRGFSTVMRWNCSSLRPAALSWARMVVAT